VIRVTDPDPVNALANAPDVRAPMMLGMWEPLAPLDFSASVEDPNNVVLMEDGFCAIFTWSAPFTYEVHIMARPDSRGAAGMHIGRKMLGYMQDHGARVVWGRPSIFNRAAICYIRRMGLKEAGFGVHPIIGECQYFIGGL
jgi:hypothetical protein